MPLRMSEYGSSHRQALITGMIGPTRGILDPWCVTAARKSRSSSHARRLHMASHQRRFGVTDARYPQGWIFASDRLATAPWLSQRGQGHDAVMSDCEMTAAGACMMGESDVWRPCGVCVAYWICHPTKHVQSRRKWSKHQKRLGKLSK